MKIPSIQPLHPLQPVHTTPRHPIRQRCKPQKPTDNSYNNRRSYCPQHRLIMFLDHHRWTLCICHPRTRPWDHDTRRYRSIESSGEEKFDECPRDETGAEMGREVVVEEELTTHKIEREIMRRPSQEKVPRRIVQPETDR